MCGVGLLYEATHQEAQSLVHPPNQVRYVPRFILVYEDYVWRTVLKLQYVCGMKLSSEANHQEAQALVRTLNP